jgi:hypothetical protein
VKLGEFLIFSTATSLSIQFVCQPLVISHTFSIEAIFVYKQKLKTETRKPRIQKDFKHFLLSLVHYRSSKVKQRQSFVEVMATYLSLLVIVSISYVCGVQFEDDASENLGQAK